VMGLSFLWCASNDRGASRSLPGEPVERATPKIWNGSD
jgi:hypothetical protein